MWQSHQHALITSPPPNVATTALCTYITFTMWQPQQRAYYITFTMWQPQQREYYFTFTMWQPQSLSITSHIQCGNIIMHHPNS